MNSERLEPVLRLLDDRPFHRWRASRLAWGAAGIVALAIGVYAWAAWAGDLFWQDRVTLDRVTSIFSLTHFWTQASDAYQPLALTLLWLERRAFGRSPLPFHCVGMVAHAASSVLVWLILRRLNVRGAWLAGALFAVHPTQVQSVLWISQQPHLIVAVFYLLAVWIYLRWMRIRPPLPKDLADLEPTDSPAWGGYIWALVVGAAAMLCGPAAISLPFVLLLLVWWKRGPLSHTDWARLAPFFGLALIISAAGVLLHHRWVDPLDLAAPSPSELQRVAIGGRAIAFYAINLLRLYPPQFIHPRWDPAWNLWNVLPMVLIAMLGIVAWAGRRRWGVGAAVGLLLFIALLLPGIVTVLGEAAPPVYVADYRAYLASAVPLAVIGTGLIALAAWLARFMSPRAARAAVGVAILGLVATFALLHSLTYLNAETAFQATLAHDPANVPARAQFALYVESQDPARALSVLEEANGPAATDPALLAARAHVSMALGKHDDAIAACLLAQRLVPDHPGVRLALAEAYDAAGLQAMAEARHDDAFENYQGALAAYDAARQLIGADDESIDDGIGRVLLHEGRVADSIDRFDSVIRRNPAFVPAHVHKALALFDSALQNGDRDKINQSNAEIGEALSIEPGNFEAFYAAAEMEMRSGRLANDPRKYAVAENYFRAAIQSDPNASRAWMGMGVAQSAQGRSQEAARTFERAVALNPDSAQAWTELGLVQLAQGQTKDAVRSFGRALALRPDAADALRGLAQAQSATGNQKS